MRFRAKATLAAASVAATTLTCTATAAPAFATAGPAVSTQSQAGALDVVRGKTRCFRYSYGDDGIRSVTVYFHNRCKHSRGIKVRVAQAVDGCVWVRGGDYDKKKFKGPHPTVQTVKEVSHCG
ncbi:hypothetical protein E1295_24465 [Nonomuraea mesophila]|uniref:Beta/gamma crystallin 'Greek key' domain-containing protein n=1 Tax=Nonomuraea mesophila TaxID=2530382 RepID=A0A4V2Z9J4_9ACTN|nr:hypothetical protein [Nonomuraea mesophila]TDE45318.1 hypothetical protein E1295_24465 [Nonomuraea mesophila]